MESLITRVPVSQADSRAWGEAFERVENYLRALRVRNRLVLSQISHRVLERAMARVAEDPALEPGVAAANEVRRFIQEQIDALFGADATMMDDRYAHGRAALHLADVAEQWPEVLLDAAHAPPELVARIQSTYIAAGPDLEFSNMAPRPIDLGVVSSVADETWRTFARWPVLRTAVLWGILFALLGLSFFLTRL
ncbi:MAG: hypothetical protein ACREIA_20360 [Opitutaceae bacterium]